MNKQDLNGTRTAQDIERKYNLSGMQKNIEYNSQSIVHTNNELNNFIDATTDNIENLQQQIDGQIMTFFYPGEPTLNNLPASEWPQSEYNNHLGDLYYDNNTGYAYRFAKEGSTYLWMKITDSDVVEALALANAAKDTADNKRRVFVTQPIPPYDNGDLWVQGENGDIFVCQLSRQQGSYQEGDFIIASKYTDDTVANAIVTELGGTETTVLHGSVLVIKEAVDQYAVTLTDHTEAIGELDTQIDTIVDTTGTAQGKYIHIEDSAEQPLISLELDGETSQETRSGKNLLNDISTWTFKNDYNTTRTISNNAMTVTSTVANRYSGTNYNVFPCISGKTYTLSLKATASSTNKPNVRIGKNNNIVADMIGYATSTKIGNIYEIVVTFTADSNFNLNITFYPDDNTSAIISSATFYEFMIEESSTATEYEPFGVMPSPDYPSEIKNITGRNLFDYNSAKDINNTITTAYRLFPITGLKPNTRYYFYNYSLPEQTGDNYMYLWDNTVYAQATKIAIMVPSERHLSISAVSNSSGILYLAIAYPNDTTVWNTLIPYFEKAMLTQSSVQTDYVPYDNIAVKVEGKNLFNKENIIQGYYIDDSNGNTVSHTGSYCTPYIRIEEQKDYYIFSDKTSGNWGAWYDKNGKYISGIALGAVTNAIVTSPANAKYMRFTIVGYTSLTNFDNIMIVQSSVSTTYEPYKSQTVFFPLHGQKLMEGSYLADDGIHHKRTQVTFDGSETGWLLWISGTGVKTVYINNTIKIGKATNGSRITGLCNQHSGLLNDSIVTYSNNNGTGIEIRQLIDYWGLSEETVAAWKTYLQSNPLIIEYELKEEEIIPYTTDQQEAWYKLLSLNTYKNVSNITSDAYAKIEYAKDNGLDIYETKDNAKRTYKAQEDKIAQLVIDKDSIRTAVENTKSTLENNYYTKNDADAKAQNIADGVSSDLRNIIQQNKTEIEETADQIALRVSSIETNGVDKVTTSIGYTFDDEGLKINKEGAKTNSKLDEKGLSVKDSSSQDLLYAGYKEAGEYAGQTVVETSNLVVNNFLNVHGAGRFQPYVNPVLGGHGMGCFDIGGVQ